MWNKLILKHVYSVFIIYLHLSGQINYVHLYSFIKLNTHFLIHVCVHA